MVTNAKLMGRWIAIAVAIGLFCSAETLAKKPPSPPAGPTDAELNPAIAYVQYSNRGVNVVVASADLQSQVVLTESVQNTKVSRQFGSPAWSADGQFVAFWSQDHMDDGMVTQMKLYVAKADASQVTLIRDFTTWPGPGPDFFSSGLNWSPSGKELIYSRDSAASIIAIDAVTGDTSVLLAGQFFDPTGHSALSPDSGRRAGIPGTPRREGIRRVLDARRQRDVLGYLHGARERRCRRLSTAGRPNAVYQRDQQARLQPVPSVVVARREVLGLL